MTLHDVSLGAALPADLAALLAPRGGGAVDPTRIRIERPGDGWVMDVLDLEGGRHRDGAIALVEASDDVSLSLDRRARARGTGVSLSLSAGRGSGIDADAAIDWVIGDDGTRAAVLVLDRIEAPERCLELAGRARAVGKTLVAVASHAAEVIREVRPGIPRGAMIEAALNAAGVPVVQTIDAGLALAEWIVAGGRADAAEPLAVSFADPREAARFLAARRHVEQDRSVRVVVADPEAVVTTAVPRAEDALALVEALDRLALVSHDVAVAHDEEGELDLVLSRHAGGRLDAIDAADLAAAAGLPGIPFVTVKTGAEAIAAGLDIGFPIAAKAVVRRADGSTDVGAVALDVPRLKDLRKTVAGFQKSFGDAFVFAVLQPQVVPVAEVSLGSFHEPGWGAFVWLRAAGVFGTVVDDLTVVRAPVSREAAEALVARSALRSILVSGNGRAGGDVDALLDAIETVGGLAARLGPRMKNFVLHPLAVLARGAGAFVLDVRAELGTPVRLERAVPSLRPPRRAERRRTAF